MSLLLLIIGGTLIVSMFYNSTERTIHQLTGKKVKKVANDSEQTQTMISGQPDSIQAKEIETQKVEKSTYQYKEELPKDNTALPDQPAGPKKYHIIMGAFREKKNAENYVKHLNQKGANATIVTRMDGLYLIAFGSYTTPEERKPYTTNARQICPKAWLMIYP
jgi:cell division protein FtsN